MTQKIVINRRYGGFDLSSEALKLYELHSEGRAMHDIPRDCPHLVQLIEQLGPLANTVYSNLAIVEIPDNVQWHIDEYAGLERIAENHRTWT